MNTQPGDFERTIPFIKKPEISEVANDGDLDFTKQALEAEGIKNNNFDFVIMYRNSPREDVEKIAAEGSVGVWQTNSFSLESVNWMLSRPDLFAGVVIPNKDELVELKKIVSARKVLEQ